MDTYYTVEYQIANFEDARFPFGCGKDGVILKRGTLSSARRLARRIMKKGYNARIVKVSQEYLSLCISIQGLYYFPV